MTEKLGMKKDFLFLMDEKTDTMTLNWVWWIIKKIIQRLLFDATKKITLERTLLKNASFCDWKGHPFFIFVDCPK
jgi:hypothetical protein